MYRLKSRSQRCPTSTNHKCPYIPMPPLYEPEMPQTLGDSYQRPVWH